MLTLRVFPCVAVLFATISSVSILRPKTASVISAPYTQALLILSWAFHRRTKSSPPKTDDQQDKTASGQPPLLFLPGYIFVNCELRQSIEHFSKSRLHSCCAFSSRSDRPPRLEFVMVVALNEVYISVVIPWNSNKNTKFLRPVQFAHSSPALLPSERVTLSG